MDEYGESSPFRPSCQISTYPLDEGGKMFDYHVPVQGIYTHVENLTFLIECELNSDKVYPFLV